MLNTVSHSLRYIAIEGVIGAGKTTLATMLSETLSTQQKSTGTERLGVRVVKEQFDENPFLPKFYAEQERYAFQTQIFFLLSRYRQQIELGQFNLFETTIVSDYTFYKDEIFARLTLSDSEFGLYQQVASALKAMIPKPDLIVYLQSNVERLMANISQRGRSYERHISQEYITKLYEEYNRFFFDHVDTPVLIIDTTRLDFVKNRAHYQELENKILSRVPSGVEYFIPPLSIFEN
jgi:deoxyguanosine kinase